MVQSFNSGMVDQSSCVGDDSTGRTADVLVDFEYFLNAFGYNKGRVESSLYGKDDSLIDLDADCG